MTDNKECQIMHGEDQTMTYNEKIQTIGNAR